MGNSKSIRKQHKKNNSKTQKELCDEIRNYLSGNLCRCAAYPEILKAVHLAAENRSKK